MDWYVYWYYWVKYIWDRYCYGLAVKDFNEYFKFIRQEERHRMEGWW